MTAPSFYLIVSNVCFVHYRGAIPFQEETVQAGEPAQSEEQVRIAEADSVELVQGECHRMLAL